MCRKTNIWNPEAPFTHFPLWEVCGRWVSLSGMPEVRIIHTGKHYYYRLQFSYNPQTVYSCLIRQRWGQTFFYLYGWETMAYDAERDMLTLSDYGDYIRAEV